MSNKEESNIEIKLKTLELVDQKSSAGRRKSPQDVRNPFVRRKRSKSLSSVNLFGSSCSCKKTIQKVKSVSTFKHSGRKRVLREPILKLNKCSHVVCDLKSAKDNIRKRLFGQLSKRRSGHDFRTLVQGCEQLSLANANDGVQDYSLPSFQRARAIAGKHKTEAADVKTSCSHQARMSAPPPCDVTIDELASYFETFVHIPKKMSSMAEMMYI